MGCGVRSKGKENLIPEEESRVSACILRISHDQTSLPLLSFWLLVLVASTAKFCFQSRQIYSQGSITIRQSLSLPSPSCFLFHPSFDPFHVLRSQPDPFSEEQRGKESRFQQMQCDSRRGKIVLTLSSCME